MSAAARAPSLWGAAPERCDAPYRRCLLQPLDCRALCKRGVIGRRTPPCMYLLLDLCPLLPLLAVLLLWLSLGLGPVLTWSCAVLFASSGVGRRSSCVFRAPCLTALLFGLFLAAFACCLLPVCVDVVRFVICLFTLLLSDSGLGCQRLWLWQVHMYDKEKKGSGPT